MTLKRIRSLHDLLGGNNDHHHLDKSTAVANFLAFLSQEKELSPSSPPISSISYPKIVDHHPHHLMTNNFSTSRVFECKTCNRQFPSFQALGGHRASHKKPRLSTTGAEVEADQPSHFKPKSTHECSVCGLEFSIGQALGGHMRRHRATSNNNDHSNHQLENNATASPVVKRSVSGKRVVLRLDLNLTPFENGLEFLKLGKAAPMVDCFF